jgi:hypothetical protein
LAWAALVRVPLVVNAETHIDSDLAVDGLTLIDLMQGHWRWHFPGTPHMGTGPLLLCVPAAALRGVDAATLVIGGTLQYELVIILTFLLAWRAFGARVAAWSLVPLAFASTGTIWLSGRLTGGHLLTVAWHAGAFAILHASLTRGGPARAGALGLWCGLGLYLDTMFAFTVAALVPAGVVAWIVEGASRRGPACAMAFVAGSALGFLPHVAGTRADPYDAYPAQFEPTRDREALENHVRLLAFECVPRLLGGHLLPDLRDEPDPRTVGGPRRYREASNREVVAGTIAGATLVLFAAALAALVVGPSPAPSKSIAAVADFRRDPAGAAVRWGLLASSAGVVAAFVVNLHIYNSDNYRYLVFLLVPWAVGSGLAMERLARKGREAAVLGAVAAAVLAALVTLDTGRWYARFGWVGPDFRPVRSRVEVPPTGWLREHPGVRFVVGEYWDVYRLSFLTGGRARGRPLGGPVRFPEWGDGSDVRGGGRVVIGRRTPRGWFPTATLLALRAARRAGGETVFEARNLVVVAWP